MGVGRVLLVRGLALLAVLLTVLLLVVVVLGATGVSDRMMEALVREELRSLRESLARTIRDPDELERALQAQRQGLEALYGLDKPWYSRLPDMAWRVLTLNLGSARTLRSFSGSNLVADIILERLPNTILLTTLALLFTAAIGLAIGVKLATRVGSRLDRGASYFLATSYALPSWWLGILLILLLAFRVRVFPPGGMLSSPAPPPGLPYLLDLLWHAALPVITLVLVSLGGWAYTVRTMVVNVAQEDFVTTARAKGLPERLVMRRYIIRVAAPPILTSIILGLAGSIGGAILTETVFNWPGMGRLYYDAILAVDEPVIVALTFIFTLIYILARFLLEVLYLVLDPRVRY